MSSELQDPVQDLPTPSPRRVGSKTLCALSNSRLVVTCDLGKKARHLKRVNYVVNQLSSLSLFNVCIPARSICSRKSVLMTTLSPIGAFGCNKQQETRHNAIF